MSSTSINLCRERIKAESAQRNKFLLEHAWKNDQASLDQLEDLLEPRHSHALVDMSRLRPKHRQKNEHFNIMLMRKLRLALWPNERMPTCFCGKTMDQFGDHVLSCRSHCKTAMSDAVRNGLADLMKQIYSQVKLIGNVSCVEKETRRVVKALPNLRPFDVSVTFDHILDETAWRSSLYRLGFDVTFITSKPTTSSTTRPARKTELNMRLSHGERGKFQRRGKTDNDTMITLTGDEIIGDILRQNMALIPIAISPHGHTSSIWNRHMYGTCAIPCPEFANGRINAPAAYKLACSSKVPSGVLPRADALWRAEQPDTSYSGSFHAMTPSRWFDQEFGLITSSAIASHILRAHNKNRSKPAVQCCVSKDCNCDDNPAVDEARTDVVDDVSIISFSSSARAARPADHTVHS